MKNLCLYFYSEYKTDDMVNPLLITESTTSASSDFVFVVTKKTVLKVSVANQSCRLIYNLTDYFGDSVPLACGITFCDYIGTLFIAFTNGDILSIVTDSEFPEVECTATVEGTINTALWSPDQENLACLVNNEFIFLLPSDFNSVKKVALAQTEIKNGPVSVGWGKKETQFKGSQGKNFVEPEVEQNPSDDFETTICWRGDSTSFCVNYYNPQLRKRQINIFDKLGNLQSTSENLPGLNKQIHWRPSGNLIAFNDTSAVSFLEKNGLKHGSFDLEPNCKLHKIIWNTSSSILSLIFDEDSGASVQFWTTGNYHWYCKQKFFLKDKVSCCLWLESNRFIVGLENGCFLSFYLTWTIDNVAKKDFTLVIDNSNILVTSYENGIIPPPMSHWVLGCPMSVNQVFYCSDDLKLAAVLPDRLAFFPINENAEVENVLKFPFFPRTPYLWRWFAPNVFICFMPNEKNTVLYFLSVEENSLTITRQLTISGQVGSAVTKDSTILLELLNGVLLKYTDGKISQFGSLPEFCSKLFWYEDDVFSLSERGKLYLNAEEIKSQVISFIVHSNFLFTTTFQHTLTVSELAPIKEISSRNLERGSQIITAFKSKIILQLPRGNLETIEPRTLTLLKLKELLNSQKYFKAVQLMRQQRIDMNLCVDHNPQLFFENINLFIEIDPEWIVIFINDLSNVDVTAGIYASYYSENSGRPVPTEKVNLVCQKLRTAMSENPEQYSLPILSSLIKTSKFEEAIILADTDQKLQHLLFLVDVNKLYDEALKSYNLKSALRIAEKSSKDPKEYLPFLNSLKQLPENYMKYKIDVNFSNFSSALFNLSKCEGKFDECLNLIESHILYQEGIQIYQGADQLQIIYSSYGKFLNKKLKYEEAGLMFERGLDFDNAALSYSKCGHWRRCTTLYKHTNQNEIKNLNERIISVLSSEKDFDNLGEFYLYLNETDQGIEAFCRGKIWDKAIFLSNPSTLPKIKESVLENFQFVNDEINNIMNNICKFSNRLEILRKEISKPKLNQDFDDLSSVSSMSVRTTTTRKTMKKLYNLKEGNPREEFALLFNLGELVQKMENLTTEVTSNCRALLHFKCDSEAEILQGNLKCKLEELKKLREIIWCRGDEDEQTFKDKQLFFPPPIKNRNWEISILG